MKKISLLIMILCLALCLVFAVACTDPNKDTDTDTNSNTDVNTDVNTESDVASDSDVDSDVDSDSDEVINEYRVYIKDEDGNPLNLVKVTFCDYVVENICKSAITNANGYIVVPSENYHVSGVKDLNGKYVELSELEIHFQEGSKTIEIVLMDKAN